MITTQQCRESIPFCRLTSIYLDALRGLIILVMALDHANHFIAQKHPPSEIWDGVFPVYYDVLAFLTRLVTHVAAPGFFFLKLVCQTSVSKEKTIQLGANSTS